MASIPTALRRHWTWLALAGVLAAHLLVNVVWLRADATLRAEDQGTQLASAASAYQVISGGGLAGVWDTLRAVVGTEQPAAGYLVWVALAKVFGLSIFSLRLFNIFYLALLLASVKYVGARLGSARVGLLAAALLSLYPAMFGASRQFGADFPATAMAAAGVAALFYCECFGRTGRSALLGLAIGLGVLVRPLTLFSLAPVLALAAGWSLVRPPSSSSRGRVAINLALAASVAAAVSSLWWWGRMGRIVEALSLHEGAQVKLAWMEQSSLAYYLRHLPYGTTPFLLGVAGLALAGLVLGRRRLDLRRRPEPWLVWTWLVLGRGTLLLLDVHMLRYMFPVLPALALVTAHGLCCLPHRKSRRLMVATVTVTAALCWLICSFFVGPPAEAGAGSEERCSTYLCGSWRYGGPPDADPPYQMARRVSGVLRKAHGDGKGVVVRLPLDFANDQDHEILHAFVVANAALMVELPRAMISGRSWATSRRPDRGDDLLHSHFCGLSTARATPHVHCYTLIIRQADRAAPAVTGTRVFEETTRFAGDPLRVTLWRHRPCPSAAHRR